MMFQLIIVNKYKTIMYKGQKQAHVSEMTQCGSHLVY